MPPLWSAAKTKHRPFRSYVLLFCFIIAFATGCGSIRYYQQAIAGQYEILTKREPIPEVIAKADTGPVLREKLQLVLDLREFAGRELQLKTDGHYASYADLGRRYVVWNVYAAPEFSVEPKKWWYPVVGRLKYRGFFSEKDAQACGELLARDGYDVYIGGVDAYSTLGWFKDPVLNTFIYQAPHDLAETLFHELAHQRVFAKGDTDFNEAFATAVGEEGVRRWLEAHGDSKMRADYETELQREGQFVELVMKAREELKRIYGEEPLHQPRNTPSPGSEPIVNARRAEKEEVIVRLRANYEKLQAGWGGYKGYDDWFKHPINNARLNTIATYHHLVPAFKRLLASDGGDLQKFYADAKAIASLAKEQRHERMTALAALPEEIVTAQAR
jgi:predicted aminopeptidase